MVMFDILALDMGMVMAIISPSHIFWSLSLQALQLEVHQAVPHWNLGVLLAPRPVGHGSSCSGLLPVHH